MSLKDINKKTVNIGDKVVVLCKEYGFKKITDACLVKATYTGIGQWGHEFKTKYYDIRTKNPQCVKI